MLSVGRAVYSKDLILTCGFCEAPFGQGGSLNSVVQIRGR